jgi:hypothetical protein
VQQPLSGSVVDSAALHTSSSSSRIDGSISLARRLMGHQLMLGSSSSSRSSAGLQDDTCAMPAGPLVLKHAANLPGVAPPGSYRMRLAAADVVTQQELMCVDVWFRVS